MSDTDMSGVTRARQDATVGDFLGAQDMRSEDLHESPQLPATQQPRPSDSDPSDLAANVAATKPSNWKDKFARWFSFKPSWSFFKSGAEKISGEKAKPKAMERLSSKQQKAETAKAKAMQQISSQQQERVDWKDEQKGIITENSNAVDKLDTQVQEFLRDFSKYQKENPTVYTDSFKKQLQAQCTAAKDLNNTAKSSLGNVRTLGRGKVESDINKAVEARKKLVETITKSTKDKEKLAKSKREEIERRTKTSETVFGIGKGSKGLSPEFDAYLEELRKP